MGSPKKLNNDQVERLLIAIEHLKEAGNTQAHIVYLALEKQADLFGKKRVLLTAFSQCYSLLLVMNMAVNSKVSPGNFKRKLKEPRLDLGDKK